MAEAIDRRYLGALKCVDRATGFHLTREIKIEPKQVRYFRNHSSLYVIQEAPGLEQYTHVFKPVPSEPATGSVAVTVQLSDPLNQYLPRRLRIELPRDADPSHRDQQDSLFNPVQVKLYAAPNASLMANWSTVRASVIRTGDETDEEPVAGALLRVVRTADDFVLSSGLSDQRGEALVIVPGVPITQFADEADGDDDDDEPAPVIVSEIPARLEVSLPAIPVWPVDPDELELNHSSNLVKSENLTLRTGRMEKRTIQLT
jgi:hypothetical protein